MTPTNPSVTLAHKVKRSDDVMMQEVGGEAVLLDLDSEQYFGLDPVGTRIWALLGETHLLADVLQLLCEEFDAEPTRIEADLLALMGKMRAAGLVKFI